LTGALIWGLVLVWISGCELLALTLPKPVYKKKISDPQDRLAEKQRGLKAKRRLKEILAHGEAQPEGLFIHTFLDKKGKYGRVLGDIKYIYARDLYNHKEGSKPWVGWKSVATELLNEGLVDIYE